MRIHHLNCGCMCPVGGALFDGFSRGPTARLICHCLLVETERGLVLVDTGFGTRDMRQPTPRLSPLFVRMNRIQFDERLTAIEQVRALGFSPRDVRHIVLTHLDFDHAGGVEDFPGATVHVMSEELEAAQARRGFIAENRYRPQQWDDVHDWRLYGPRGERWFGFEAVRDLDGLPPEILLVPLPGHSRGHAGVAIDTGADGWLLDAGDVYFFRHEMDRETREAPLAARAYQRLMAVDHDLHLRNQARVRELAHSKRRELRVFCSHDAVEFAALAA
ncbi:MAG: MBL fold metallo-hydrolase [Methylobacteriaceae bacterium]|nr:MBL fold metallo-hydrolase [Methylobacteriaceae bacterium]